MGCELRQAAEDEACAMQRARLRRLAGRGSCRTLGLCGCKTHAPSCDCIIRATSREAAFVHVEVFATAAGTAIADGRLLFAAAREQLEKLVDSDRLRQMTGKARGTAAREVFRFAVSGDGDQRDLAAPRCAPDLVRERVARHAVHADVEHGGVGLELGAYAQRLF